MLEKNIFHCHLSHKLYQSTLVQFLTNSSLFVFLQYLQKTKLILVSRASLLTWLEEALELNKEITKFTLF